MQDIFTIFLTPEFENYNHGYWHCSNNGTELLMVIVRCDFGYCGHYWPIVPAPDDRWWWLWRNWWNKDWQGKPKYSEKTCPSATLSTTNPTWLNPDLNLGRRGGKPATKHLSYGTASVAIYYNLHSQNAFGGNFTPYIINTSGNVVIHIIYPWKNTSFRNLIFWLEL
jgi:hypothetical protein